MKVDVNRQLLDILDDTSSSSADKLTKIKDMFLLVDKMNGNMPFSREVLINNSIKAYFKNNTIKKPYDYGHISSNLIYYINKSIQLDNATGAHERYKGITTLGIAELSLIIFNLFKFKNVRRDVSASSESTSLMYYTENGWYEDASEFISRICYELRLGVPLKDIKEVENIVSYLSGEPVDEERNPDWVFCKNGIFDKKYWEENQELIPYSEDIIAVNPLPIEFNPNALTSNFQFSGEDFDIEDFLFSIANYEDDIKNLLWDVLSAEVYHNRNFKKAVYLYSSIGNNGKGTFLTLCRSVVGSDLCANIPIDSFSDKNLIINLMNSRLVAGDENLVDSYIDNSTNFKNAVTSDPITVDRKYKSSITFSFKGLIIQCMNGLPTTKDKTNSFYRRLLLVPFNNCFTGKENTKIKDVYLKDKDVLEYVLYKALMRNVQELDDCDSTLNILKEYKEDNDTLIQWWNDEGSQVDYAWDKIPWCLLYGSYIWWMGNNSVRRDTNMSSRKFIKEFKTKLLPLISEWEDAGQNGFAVSVYWNNPEPLIGKYNIDELKNPNYTGKDWTKIGSNGNQYKHTYKGLVRVLREDGEQDD